MAKYRKKPVVIDATQWFKNGDHPKVCCDVHAVLDALSFVHPRPDVIIKVNEYEESNHGVIENSDGRYIVCPGDWIIEDATGKFCPCDPHIFEATYEPIP